MKIVVVFLNLVLVVFWPIVSWPVSALAAQEIQSAEKIEELVEETTIRETEKTLPSYLKEPYFEHIKGNGRTNLHREWSNLYLKTYTTGYADHIAIFFRNEQDERIIYAEWKHFAGDYYVVTGYTYDYESQKFVFDKKKVLRKTQKKGSEVPWRY